MPHTNYKDIVKQALSFCSYLCHMDICLKIKKNLQITQLPSIHDGFLNTQNIDNDKGNIPIQYSRKRLNTSYVNA